MRLLRNVSVPSNHLRHLSEKSMGCAYFYDLDYGRFGYIRIGSEGDAGGSAPQDNASCTIDSIGEIQTQHGKWLKFHHIDRKKHRIRAITFKSADERGQRITILILKHRSKEIVGIADAIVPQ